MTTKPLRQEIEGLEKSLLDNGFPHSFMVRDVLEALDKKIEQIEKMKSTRFIDMNHNNIVYSAMADCAKTEKVKRAFHMELIPKEAILAILREDKRTKGND